MAHTSDHELIVVPLDGSEQAEQVIPYAEALRGSDGTLLFFQAFYPSGPARGLFGDVELTMEDMVAQEREAADNRLAEIAERWDSVLGKKPQVESFAGDTVEAITAIVRDRNATLLAISSSGRGALSRWAFGSVADNLMRTSPEPVLIIHPDPESDDAVKAVELKRILVPLDGSETAETRVAGGWTSGKKHEPAGRAGAGDQSVPRIFDDRAGNGPDHLRSLQPGGKRLD